jgi:hypothetical protein
MNNRKQKVFSMLDSLTKKEIYDYIKERNIIAKGMKEDLSRIAKTKQPSHFETLSNNITGNLNEILSNHYRLGEAYIVAFVLECFYDNKYKIKDLQWYLKEMIKADETLKEYVYEIMKDF